MNDEEYALSQWETDGGAVIPSPYRRLVTAIEREFNLSALRDPSDDIIARYVSERDIENPS